MIRFKKIVDRLKYSKRVLDISKIGEILVTDIHSHILPNIDDGAKSIDESIAMIEALIDLGYKRAILTPHVMREGYNNSKNTILFKLELLREELERRELNFYIDAAAEYYMDEEFKNRLLKDDVLLIGKKYLLFETSYLATPLFFEEMIYEMKARGYIPLIAHPERYVYIDRDFEIYKKWKELGILFQIEINSFNGKYGKEALKKAVWLSKKGWIDFLGSDAHSIKDINRIKKDEWIYNILEVIYSNCIKNRQELG